MLVELLAFECSTTAASNRGMMNIWISVFMWTFPPLKHWHSLAWNTCTSGQFSPVHSAYCVCAVAMAGRKEFAASDDLRSCSDDISFSKDGVFEVQIMLKKDLNMYYPVPKVVRSPICTIGGTKKLPIRKTCRNKLDLPCWELSVELSNLKSGAVFLYSRDMSKGAEMRLYIRRDLEQGMTSLSCPSKEVNRGGKYTLVVWSAPNMHPDSK